MCAIVLPQTLNVLDVLFLLADFFLHFGPVDSRGLHQLCLQVL